MANLKKEGLKITVIDITFSCSPVQLNAERNGVVSADAKAALSRGGVNCGGGSARGSSMTVPCACEEQGALKGTGAAELCAADKGQGMWFRLLIPLLSLPSRRALIRVVIDFAVRQGRAASFLEAA